MNGNKPALKPAAVQAPAAKRDMPLTGHTYDGIVEYDNPTPGWWTWGFILTILFSAVYFPVTLLVSGQASPEAAYKRAVADEMARQAGSIGELGHDRATLELVAGNEGLLAAGRSVFLANCASCHGRSGEGSPTAPNMTDDHYLNVSTLEDVLDVVANGRNNGAMPAWKSRLSPNDVVFVSAYVASLKGTHAAGGKTAEGTRVDGL